MSNRAPIDNAFTLLNKAVQLRHLPNPVYDVRRSGPEHGAAFTGTYTFTWPHGVAIPVPGQTCSSKDAAEENAAIAARIWVETNYRLPCKLSRTPIKFKLTDP